MSQVILFGACTLAFSIAAARRVGGFDWGLCAGIALVVSPVAAFCIGEYLAAAVLFAALVVCSVTDLRSGYILDVVTVPAFITELAASGSAAGLLDAVRAALLCAGALGFLYLITRGRGIGLGDVKLALCIGAGLGMQAGAYALGAAFVLGGVHAAGLLWTGGAKRGDALRFAPYLAMGCTACIVARGAF